MPCDRPATETRDRTVGRRRVCCDFVLLEIFIGLPSSGPMVRRNGKLIAHGYKDLSMVRTTLHVDLLRSSLVLPASNEDVQT